MNENRGAGTSFAPRHYFSLRLWEWHSPIKQKWSLPKESLTISVGLNFFLNMHVGCKIPMRHDG